MPVNAVPVTSKLLHLARRTSVLLLAGGLVLAASGPAGADVPEFWDGGESQAVDPWHAIWLVVIPLVMFVVITAIVLLPGIIRGERFTPGGQATADQWFGGPDTAPAELAAPEADQPESGGASGRW